MPFGSALDNLSLDRRTAALGAVIRNLEQAILDQGFNVKQFGAVGDNVHDDTDAIQAAIDAAGAVRGTVFFPPGLYRVMPKANGYCLSMDAWDYMRLVGCGGGNFGSTIRVGTHSFTGLLTCGVATNRVVQCPQIVGLCFQGDDGSAAYGTSTGIGLDFRATSIRMQDVTLQQFGGEAFIKLTTGAGQAVFDNTFKDMYLYTPLTANTDGFYLEGANGGTVTDCEWDTVKVDGVRPGGGAKAGRYAFNVNGNTSGGYQFTNCHPFFWANAGYMLGSVGNVLIHGGQVESCGGSGGNGGITSIAARMIDVHDVLMYGNYGVDIQINWESTDWNVHDNIFNAGANIFDAGSTSLTRNIYASSGSSNPTTRLKIHHNRFLTAGVAGPVANVQLDSGTTRCLVTANHYDRLLTETGTTTGSRRNIFAGWNDGPAASITKVDASTSIGADNTQAA